MVESLYIRRPLRAASCLLAAVVVLTSIAACDSAERDTETVGDDEAALGSAPVADYSDEASAIYAVVNTASAAALMSDVKLTALASNNIFAHRVGSDRTPGTADDNPFGSVAELDAIPGVGTVAFRRLLAYVARGNDSVFDPATCEGAAMGAGEARGRFWARNSGIYRVTLGTVRLSSRHRTCTGAQCSAWAVAVRDAPIEATQLIVRYGHDFKLALGWDSHCAIGATCPATDTVLTNHCWQVHNLQTSRPDSAGNHVETELFHRVSFDPAACVRTDCFEQGVNGGPILDQCGGMLDCGSDSSTLSQCCCQAKSRPVVGNYDGRWTCMYSDLYPEAQCTAVSGPSNCSTVPVP